MTSFCYNKFKARVSETEAWRRREVITEEQTDRWKAHSSEIGDIRKRNLSLGRFAAEVKRHVSLVPVSWHVPPWFVAETQARVKGATGPTALVVLYFKC